VKAAIAILAAALAGCSTFHDPAASAVDLAGCKAEAKEARKGADSMWVVTAPVAILERHKLQHDAFEQCMAAKGYKVAAKGNL